MGLQLSIINTILGVPLGFVIYFAYRLTGSYGMAIVAFAIIVKIVIFPVMAIAHRNSIRLLQLQPAIDVLKHRFAGDKEGLNEAQHELFQKERYNPLMGVLPLIVQLFLVMGMLQVMYHPLQHMLRLDSNVIDVLVQALHSIEGVQLGFAEQLDVFEVFAGNSHVFQSVLGGLPNGNEIFNTIAGTELYFLGLNLGATPSLLNPSWELIIIVLSGIVALIFCLVQNAISPGALSQSARTNRGLTIFTVSLSVYFAWALPVGVGLYWTVGNTAAIGVVLLLNLLFPPKKLAAKAIAHIQKTRPTPEQLKKEREQKKEYSIREKHDIAQFKSAKKQVVFYALTGGQYRYYKNTIEYILENSDVTVHYLTNDPTDAVLNLEHEHFKSYYASQQKTIRLMLHLDCDIMATTVTCLQIYHMKRSIVRDDIEYIFVPHTLASLHVVMRATACDHFDTVMCVGAHNIAEVRRRETLAKLPKKKLIKAGYGLYDQLATSYESIVAQATTHAKPRILIAPSWQIDNILDLCIDELLPALLGQGYEITIRPHPQYIRLFPERMSALQKQYADYVTKGELDFGLNFADNNSVFTADLLITDWSNIAFEFAYCTLKPCVFINTPMKVMNPSYKQYGVEIVDITLRDKVGVSIDVDNISSAKETVTSLLSSKDDYKEQITQVIEQYLYYPRRNGEAGGKYIINQLERR